MLGADADLVYRDRISNSSAGHADGTQEFALDV